MPNVDLESLHRFHPYCALFSSEIVQTALEGYSKPGESVLDPFCGSGTTLGFDGLMTQEYLVVLHKPQRSVRVAGGLHA
jgi:DNA methylase